MQLTITKYQFSESSISKVHGLSVEKKLKNTRNNGESLLYRTLTSLYVVQVYIIVFYNDRWQVLCNK